MMDFDTFLDATRATLFPGTLWHFPNTFHIKQSGYCFFAEYKLITCYIPSSYNVFLYFYEGQVHKDYKLGIMTNVGKSMLVKVIFTNIHKISDACAQFL